MECAHCLAQRLCKPTINKYKLNPELFCAVPHLQLSAPEGGAGVPAKEDKEWSEVPTGRLWFRAAVVKLCLDCPGPRDQPVCFLGCAKITARRARGSKVKTWRPGEE